MFIALDIAAFVRAKFFSRWSGTFTLGVSAVLLHHDSFIGFHL
jgi:hypothetical protein